LSDLVAEVALQLDWSISPVPNTVNSKIVGSTASTNKNNDNSSKSNTESDANTDHSAATGSLNTCDSLESSNCEDDLNKTNPTSNISTSSMSNTPNTVNGYTPHILERYLRNGQSYQITPSQEEIDRLCNAAESQGLEDRYIQSLRSHDKDALQLKIILLLMSLPTLSSFHLEHDRPNKLFDTLFLKATQEGKLLPNLTDFKREYKDYYNRFRKETCPVGINGILPIILAPKIQTVTAVSGFIGHPTKSYEKIGNEYQEFVSRSRLRFHYGTSSLHTLNLRNCYIEAGALDFLLMFPKSLHTLFLEPYPSYSNNEPAPHFTEIQRALANVSHSLVRLHISKSDWKFDNYQPDEVFKGLKRLKQLAIPLALLVSQNISHRYMQMGNVSNFFPSTLEELTVILDYFPTSQKRKTCMDLIEELVRLKVQGIKEELKQESREDPAGELGEGRPAVNITAIGIDEWRPDFEERTRMKTLVIAARGAGITIWSVPRRDKPFEYTKFVQAGGAKSSETR
jgi:hypothetical protein